MFTSRAEFRLSLRADNADERLTPLARDLGIAGPDRLKRFAARHEELNRARHMAASLKISPSEARRHGLDINQDGVRRSAFDLLSYPSIDLARLREIWPELGAIDSRTSDLLETEARYAVYLDKQAQDAALLRREEERTIPDGLDFSAIAGLSNELRSKLEARRPRSIAEAQRIDGMTPSALALILTMARHLEDQERRGAA